MGCTASTLNSLQLKTIEQQQTPPSSSNPNEFQKPYSISAPFVHHPSLHKGDTNHLVCLTSSTYGSINLVAVDNDGKIETCNIIDEKIESFNSLDDCVVDKCDNNVINTWELMEGLEGDVDELHDDVGKSFELGSLDFGYFDPTPEKSRWDFVDCGEKLKNLCDFDGENCFKSGFSLSDSVKKLSDDGSFVFVELPRGDVDEKELNLVSNSKPLWKHLCEKTNLTSERALSVRELGVDHTRIVSKSVGYSSMVSESCGDDGEKIVLYFTSLRGIRRTYEDCCLVRLILRGFRVMIEEKDISMDLNYRKELQSVLGGKAMSLPQLFIGKRHIGGAEEIKEMHEAGELERLLDGFPVWDRGFVCERCSESRFIPCLNCNGSQKVFHEEEGQTSKCPECNENGLVRCPGCCS